MKLRPYVTTLALAIASVGAQAANNTENSGDIVKISEWTYETLYDGTAMQSEEILNGEVFGPDGEEIGNIENLILDDQNKIIAVIAEVGGLWDIGDTHVAVPWEEVEHTADGFQIPVTEENFDDYGLFYAENDFVTKESLDQSIQVDDSLATGPRTWKITSLIDDYATLTGGIGYGYVDNVLFSEDGQIKAVVIESVGTYGNEPYAYPFYGYDFGWSPGFGAYELPYDENEVGDMEAFDYEQI